MTKAKAILDKLVFGAFLVLVASLGVQKPAVTVLFGKPVTTTDVIFPVVLLLTILGLLFKRQWPRLNTIYFYFLAYIAVFFISSFFSPSPEISFAKTFATTYLVGLAVISIVLIDSEKRLVLTVVAWLAGALIPLTIGIGTICLYYVSPSSSLLPYVTYHSGAVPMGNFPRLSSTFVSASMFCNYLTATALLALYARQFTRLARPLWWLLLSTTVLCAMFTISAGLGAFILGIAIWFCYSMNCSTTGRLVKHAGIATCALSLILSFIALQPHSTAPYSFQLPIIGIELFPSSRLLVWTEAATTFVDNLLTGNGPGMPSASVKFQNTNGSFSLLTDAHNSYLSVAAQTGILGLAALVAISVYCLRSGFGGRPISPIRFSLAIAFLCGFVVQGFTSSFEDARHMWVLIGMLIASVEIEAVEKSGVSD